MLEEKIDKWKDAKELTSNSLIFYFVATLWTHENMWASSLGWKVEMEVRRKEKSECEELCGLTIAQEQNVENEPQKQGKKRFSLLIEPLMNSPPDIILLSEIKELGNYTEDKIRLTKCEKEDIVSEFLHRKDCNLESKWNWAQVCLLFLSDKIVQRLQKNLNYVLSQIYYTHVLGLSPLKTLFVVSLGESRTWWKLKYFIDDLVLFFCNDPWRIY